jgi:hypothetical protein
MRTEATCTSLTPLGTPAFLKNNTASHVSGRDICRSSQIRLPFPRLCIHMGNLHPRDSIPTNRSQQPREYDSTWDSFDRVWFDSLSKGTHRIVGMAGLACWIFTLLFVAFGRSEYLQRLVGD